MAVATPIHTNPDASDQKNGVAAGNSIGIWILGFGIWDLLSSLARLRSERGVRGESLEMRALHEGLSEVFGIDDLRDHRQPDVAIRRRHAVVVLGHRRVRAVGHAVLSQISRTQAIRD